MYENTETTGVPVVDDDEKLAELDAEIQALFSSYYEFDSHDEPVLLLRRVQRADDDLRGLDLGATFEWSLRHAGVLQLPELGRWQWDGVV